MQQQQQKWFIYLSMFATQLLQVLGASVARQTTDPQVPCTTFLIVILFLFLVIIPFFLFVIYKKSYY